MLSFTSGQRDDKVEMNMKKMQVKRRAAEGRQKKIM